MSDVDHAAVTPRKIPASGLGTEPYISRAVVARPMKSCLYECHMTHARFSPRAHRFAYRIFLFALDLDEVEELDRRLPLFSHNARNLYSFRDRDFLPSNETKHNASARPGATTSPATLAGSTLKQRVTDHLREHGIDLTNGRVVLVTLPRILGTLFNPVSFYYCYDSSGELVAALAEVTNTFREMKSYFLGRPSVQSNGPATFRQRHPKHFYVSPFSDVDVAFDFNLRALSSQLHVQIDDYTNGERTFTSSLSGDRRELTSSRLFWYTLKYPLLTLRIITLIHWQALRLWMKKTPWFPKAARSSDQRDLYRAHASLARTASTATSPGASAIAPVNDAPLSLEPSA